MVAIHESDGSNPDLSDAIARMLGRDFDGHGPGAVVGVYRDGSLIASGAVGLAWLDGGEPMSVTMPVEVASVSKQLGAAAILILAREGIVDIDRDIRDYVPELPVADITVRHCLQHTSGLSDYLALSEVFGVPLGTMCGYDAFLSHISRTTELQFLPGTDVSYSNTGYVLAAIAAERASGSLWPQIISSRVFEPLGMVNSQVRTYVGQPGSGVAKSYSVKERSKFTIEEMDEHWPPVGARHTVGDGQIMTTITDFAGWQGFLLDGRILGEDIRQQLIRPAVLGNGRANLYGLGIRHETVGEATAFGHSGSMWGFRSYSLTVPAAGVGVAVFGNRSDLDPGDLAWRTYHLATGRPGLYGDWYAPNAERVLELRPTADNGLIANDGWETATLTRQTGSAWTNEREFGHIRWEGDGIVAIDLMGRRVAYSHLTPTSAPLHEAIGIYQNEQPPARFTIREGAQGLELVLGTATTLPLRYLTSHEAADVYASGDCVIRIEKTATGDQTLTISAGSATVRAVPRIAERIAHDR